MKRLLAAALMFGSFSTLTLVGCEQKAEEKSVKTSTSPEGGTTKVTESTKVETSGSNPPAAPK